MKKVNPHTHSFDQDQWPFSEPVNTLAYTSAQVLQGSPILLVFHDHDGEWQFLHGEINKDDECQIICLGCAYEREPCLAQLSDLPSGWLARRKAGSIVWYREAYEDSDEGL
jgi:hypothetical protein